MARAHQFMGIDIGSSQVRVVVAQKDAERDVPTILGVGVAEMHGMQKGVITDIEEAVGAVSRALDQAERISGSPVERAYVSINGSHISSQSSRGVIAIGRADGEVTAEDVARVINAAQAISLPSNREILHVLPQHFIVDGQEHVQDPVGMTGVRLEVEAHMIEGSGPFVKNLTKVVNQSGVHIEDFVFAPLAASLSVLDKRQRELGVALVDLGAGTTSMAVYEEGMLLHTGILPVGSSHITNDIAIGLRTSVDVAEDIKISHGTALPAEVKANELIVVDDASGSDNGEQLSVPRKEVADIIAARLEELFSFVDRELKTIKRSGLLPAGVVITGGGAHLSGLVEVAKRRLRLPIRIGRPHKFEGLTDHADDPRFAVPVGLVLWAIEQEMRATPRSSVHIPNVAKTVSQMREWFRAFMP